MEKTLLGCFSGSEAVGLDAPSPGLGRWDSPCHHLPGFASHLSPNTGARAAPSALVWSIAFQPDKMQTARRWLQSFSSSLCKGLADETETLVLTPPPSRKPEPTATVLCCCFRHSSLLVIKPPCVLPNK